MRTQTQIIALLAASAALAALFSTDTACAQSQESQQVAPVVCGGENGTAFYTGDGRLLTAAHVTEEGTCRLNGAEVRRMDRDQKRDYASLRGGASLQQVQISCAPIQEGEQYRLVGYPAGSHDAEPMQVFARATGETHDIKDERGRVRFSEMASFRGEAVRGMSGGPVLDSQGNVVAVISSVSPSARVTLAQPMANTRYCQGG